QFVRSPDKAAFIREFPRDVSPTTDDRPYFFNFSKWRNPLASARHIAEPTSVSQGNPLFILGQLALSTLFAMVFVVAPLFAFRRRRIERLHVGRLLVFFAGLGLGFIAIEIAAIQKLTLLLGQPLYSLTVTLFSVLFFAGLGSVLSARWFETPGARPWTVPV